MSASLSLHPLTRPDAAWWFSLYPDAGEGGGSFRSSVRRTAAYVSRGAAKDPERAAAEAGRRARATLRRYCAANRLNRLGTLTYAGTGNHDALLVREHLAEFFRSLRESLGGRALPYVWVPEWHKSGHGLHAHFAVGRYIRRSVIVDAWSHGFVHIKLLGDLPVGSDTVSEARRAAGYLSKYVAKTFADPDARVAGLHRYDVAQGFQPEVMRLSGRSADAVIAQASELMSGGAGHPVGLVGESGLAGPSGDLGAVGALMVIDREALQAWVEQSCAVQGVGVFVQDPGIVARVGSLLGSGVPAVAP